MRISFVLFFLLISPLPEHKSPCVLKRRGCHARDISDWKRYRKKHNKSPRIYRARSLCFLLLCNEIFQFYVTRSEMILVLINCQFLFALPVFFYVSAKHLSRKVYFILFLPT